MDNIRKALDGLGFSPLHAVECGAAHPTTSLLRDYVAGGIRCDLFEPNPRLFHCLYHGYDKGDFATTWPAVSRYPHDFAGWGHLSNVRLFNVALGDFAGYGRLFEHNASSYIEGVASPARVNDKPDETLLPSYLVTVQPFDLYDDGTIDLLVADCEGSEWFIIKRLKSRPTIICAEMHGGLYRNPHGAEIEAWIKDNGYQPLIATDSDIVWGRKDKIVSP